MATIKPTLHHVTMKTSRLDDMIAWYAFVLGARGPVPRCDRVLDDQ